MKTVATAVSFLVIVVGAIAAVIAAIEGWSALKALF